MVVNENRQAYRFRYDDLNRLVEETRIDGSRQSFEYSDNNEVVAVIDHPGEGDVVEGHAAVQSIRTAITRDALGRLVEKRLPDAHYQYRHDPVSRLLEAVKSTVDGQPLHTSRFGYNKLGDLIREEAIDAATGSSVLEHQHDALGNRIATTLPDGRTLHHLYYGSGHLHQINLDGALIADFERDDLHREVLRTQGRLSSRFAYDPLGRKTGVWTQSSILRSGMWDPKNPDWESRFSKPDASDVLLKQYRYDPSGELRSAKHNRNGDTEHRYDATGRIESTLASIQQLDEFFYFDPAGNRITALEKAEGWGQIKNNRVKVMEDKRFDHDGFGRLIRKRIGAHTVQHFKHDCEHRMITAAVIRTNTADGKPLHQLFHYRYDAFGRRIAKQDAFGETSFTWEGMRLLQEQRGGKCHFPALRRHPFSA
ncbi:MAG: RHS repeat protein [Prolixibacteraceae bacterium]|nr:RHS repeat protein [Burkholderiales bacterium]